MGQLSRTLVRAHGRPSRCRAFSALFPRAHSSSLQLRKGEVVAARAAPSTRARGAQPLLLRGLGLGLGNEEGGAAGGRAARPRRSGTDVSWRTLLGARVTAVRRPRGEALDSSGDEKDGEYERIEAK